MPSRPLLSGNRLCVLSRCAPFLLWPGRHPGRGLRSAELEGMPLTGRLRSPERQFTTRRLVRVVSVFLGGAHPPIDVPARSERAGGAQAQIPYTPARPAT